ncbi:c-type cytochrome [Phenylobacterium sp. VNQ135]|uniref:c-type cytochrome n=1 Tax=Phenylobacterium sp. VNQ135 TaxID=3400922 RepID=UPI003C090ADD
MTGRLRTMAISTLAILGSALGAASLPAQAADEPVGDEEAGAELYAAQCRGCHTVSIAPTLRGVVERPIASVADFGGYSEALKAKSGQTWTLENLDAFLAAPQAFAPGTRMVLAVPDAQARADIIAYLRTLPPPRATQ